MPPLDPPYILLVEEEDESAALARRAFRQAGASLALNVVRDGPEAVEFLTATGAHRGRNPAAVPLLTLLDARCPDAAIELLRVIRSHWRLRAITIALLTRAPLESAPLPGGLGSLLRYRKPSSLAEFVAFANYLLWLLPLTADAV
jgi:two-component system, response regulator